MTDRDTLLALAERVEGLSNPDREVDVLVGANINGTIDVPGVLGCYFPAYTASIDAAKTLVPKGWHVGMLTECDEDDSPSCCLTQNEEPCRDAVGRGADMALSLVAASLRARAGGL
ncbi:hypothetical protein [Sphingobium sp.]|uniref:hypothetical protein n=1 Tax=Sphingobium sp. TaxID=1912891 RepID=UPI000DB3DE0E|nr:hypothetical protein [Sphingobium sp.]PZU65205.1 MAG: hypothetical protein DI540_17695 [Sphingobium sp.]